MPNTDFSSDAMAAAFAPSVWPITLNPGGISSASSPWLIHALTDSPTPFRRSLSLSIVSNDEPYSLFALFTLPPYLFTIS